MIVHHVRPYSRAEHGTVGPYSELTELRWERPDTWVCREDGLLEWWASSGECSELLACCSWCWLIAELFMDMAITLLTSWWWLCMAAVEVWLPAWHGFPSFTSTGTATRRGDCCCWQEPESCCIWCWDALSLACRFILYRWFWNHIFTCVGVRWIIVAKCSRSGADRYFCCLNRRSSSYTWAWEKSTRRFLRGVLGKGPMLLPTSAREPRLPILPMFMPDDEPIKRETGEGEGGKETPVIKVVQLLQMILYQMLYININY